MPSLPQDIRLAPEISDGRIRTCICLKAILPFVPRQKGVIDFFLVFIRRCFCDSPCRSPPYDIDIIWQVGARSFLRLYFVVERRYLSSSIQSFDTLYTKESYGKDLPTGANWASEIRTHVSKNQNLMPYHLAIAQCFSLSVEAPDLH